MKKCKKCNKEKELDNFCNKKNEKDGKHRYCKLCMKGESDNYYEISKKERADYYKQYRVENQEYYKNYNKIHYQENKEWYRNWERERLKNDLGFRLKKVVAARINDALRVYNKVKLDRTIEYLGCNMEYYTQYLESKFTPIMTWENYGTEWEIDHIKPICKFDLLNEEEMYECFHYSNTQPLNKVENREKSGRY